MSLSKPTWWHGFNEEGDCCQDNCWGQRLPQLIGMSLEPGNSAGRVSLWRGIGQRHPGAGAQACKVTAGQRCRLAS